MGKKGLKASSKARLRASKIEDVEKGLDAVRKEVEIHGAPLAEQPSSALFTIDQKGLISTAGQKSLKGRGLLLNKPLRIDEILRPSSGIPAIGKDGKSKGPSVAEKKMIAKKSKVKHENPLPKKEKKSLDLWADEPNADSLPNKKRKERLIEIPNAGASYRPPAEAHQQLMEEAAKVEIEKMERAAELNKELPPSLRRAKMKTIFEEAVEQVLQGIDHTVVVEEEDDDEKTIDDENSIVSQAENNIPSSKAPKKKTRKERKKEEKAKALAVARRAREADRKHILELNSLKSIALQVKMEMLAKMQQQNKPKQKPKQRRKQRQKSNIPIAVNLPEEIPTSLRQIKTEGNLIKEQFSSIQRRALTGLVRKRVRFSS